MPTQENLTFPHRRGGPISKQDRAKILVMDLKETEARNDCGEDQQQFNRLTNQQSIDINFQGSHQFVSCKWLS
jgi:hypothetical protein